MQTPSRNPLAAAVDDHPLIDLSATSTIEVETLPPTSPQITPTNEDFFSPRGQDLESSTSTAASIETPKATTSGGITTRIKRKKNEETLNKSTSGRPQRKAKLDVSYVNQC